MSKSSLVDLSVQFITQTEKAVCIREVEDGPDIWIPKSQCEIEQTDPRRYHYVLLTVETGVAREKGLI